MASPDLVNGYIQLPLELDAAMSCADFPKAALIVLAEVFSQVYGPGKMTTAVVRPTDLANRIGKRKEDIVRAIRGLISGGVLTRVRQCEHTFICDYESWKNPDKSPRLAPQEVAYAMAARRGVKLPPQGRSNWPRRGGQTAPAGGVKLPLPIREERTRVLNPDKEDKASKTHASDLDPSRAALLRSLETPDDSPDVPPGCVDLPSAPGAFPGEFRPTAAEMDPVYDWLDRHALGMDAAEKVRLHRQQYDPSWWIKALKRTKLTAYRGKVNWGLLQTILEGWREDGRPNAGKEDGYTDDMALRPTQERVAVVEPPGGYFQPTRRRTYETRTTTDAK